MERAAFMGADLLPARYGSVKTTPRAACRARTGQDARPPLGFTGHQYDPETGLVYARARYYDPDLGRFISRDSYEGSLSDAPSLHRYTYGQNNPLTYVDEDGHAVNLAAAGVGALIGGVGGCLVGAWSGGWEGCGKGALVGAGAGAMAGLTFGASLAATGAVGVGGTAVASGGTTGSVLVAGTMASAVGGASSGAGNVLINGGSGAEALEAAENNRIPGCGRRSRRFSRGTSHRRCGRSVHGKPGPWEGCCRRRGSRRG
jgi:RHS repeat-associated protein